MNEIIEEGIALVFLLDKTLHLTEKGQSQCHS